MEHAESDHLAHESQQPASADFHGAVARRARQLWEQRGRVDGHAQEDWLQAEAEVRLGEALSAAAARPRAYMKVKVGDSIYVVEYYRAGDYMPGELKKGQRVAMRIAQGWMYIKLPEGRKLAARIVEKSRLSPPAAH
jgi:hypothetical protein